MDKMDKNFFKYTLMLISVAIIFIIIGGISVSRARNYNNSRVIGADSSDVSVERKVEDLEEENIELKYKLSKVKEALDDGTNDEVINKIKDIVKE